MRPRRRTVLAVFGIVANLVGIAGLASFWLSLSFIGATTTTMMWVDGFDVAWTPWLWATLSIAGLFTVVVALWNGGAGGAR